MLLPSSVQKRLAALTPVSCLSYRPIAEGLEPGARGRRRHRRSV